MAAVIELKKLTKMYGNSRGVIDISLSVPKGSVFGFLGPNGAGKTTTISMLIDFIRPTSGSIALFGLDSQEQSLEIRRRVGFLAGDMALDSSLTGWQQLEYLGNVRKNFDKTYIKHLAERLDCNLHRKFKTLSRGNRQKVGLVAALMHKPELLILDEPTSGLDPLMQAEFNKIILEHQAQGGTTFISSHVLSEIQEICDTVTFIREGKIVDTKPIGDISKDSPKLLRVTSGSKTLMAKLKDLKGLTISQATATSLQGSFDGDVNELLRIIASGTVKSFNLQDADLESTFLKYYENEADHA